MTRPSPSFITDAAVAHLTSVSYAFHIYITVIVGANNASRDFGRARFHRAPMEENVGLKSRESIANDAL